ncbi:MAG: hypothetical protein II837_06805, partial [Treponema sp.]|nr:hypothetical protein [Treponema sp.]
RKGNSLGYAGKVKPLSMKHRFFAPCSQTNADLSGYGRGGIGRGKLEFVGMGKKYLTTFRVIGTTSIGYRQVEIVSV